MSEHGRRSPVPARAPAPGRWPYGRDLPDRGSYTSPEYGGTTDRLVDKSLDPDAHNLHAGVGERCMICDQVIKKGRWVRRTISGGYVHDVC
ncbi:MAG TPA: hypothetical protein VFN68_01595 [Acidimicrobiales bacterium]|nr:hypothetical protein [Acidimicrobiales bacterium]